MRWILILPLLFILALFADGLAGPDAGAVSVANPLDVLLTHAAKSTEFQHRHQSFGVECASCHGAEPDFSTVPPMAQCLSCHGSYEDVAEMTVDQIPNPHHSHMGEVTCTDCHSEHQEPRLSCNQCHVFDMMVP